MTSTTETTIATCAKLCRIRRRRWFTVLTAMSAANATWALTAVGAGIDLTVHQGDGIVRVDALHVTVVSLGVGLAAWFLLERLERRLVRARFVWWLSACGVLVVSLTGPLTATTTAAAAVLVALHLLVGSILLVGLGWSDGDGRT